MQRLLHEGMDAGLCGFSIQRLGRNSVQADFDGTPMVTDTMVDEDILCPGRGAGRAGRGLHPDHPGHRRHQGRPGLPGEAGRGRPAPDPAQRRRPRPQGPRRCTAARWRWVEKCRNQGLPIYGQCGHGPGRLRLHAGALEPLRRLSRPGEPSPPAPTRRSWPRWPTRSCARRSSSEAEEADRRLQVIQAGVGGNPQGLVIQGVHNIDQPAPATRAAPSASRRRARARTPSRSCWTCRSRATSRSSSSARTRAPTPSSWPR